MPLRFSLLYFQMVFLVGCANALRDFAAKSSPDYRVDQARKHLDAQDFTSAIEAIGPVLATDGNNEDVAYVAAAAFAGRAGLRVLDALQSFTSELGTKTPFQIFAEHMSQSTGQDLSDMDRAVNIIEAYGLYSANRSANMNYFAYFVYWGRLGAYLNIYAYDSTDTLLAGFDACVNSSTLGLPDSAVDQIMITLPRINNTGGTLPDFPVFPLDFGGIDFSSQFTAIPCTSDSTHLSCKAMRSLVNDTTIGLGSAGGAVCP